jgi:uncharacterized protein (TIGR03382 family)
MPALVVLSVLTWSVSAPTPLNPMTTSGPSRAQGFPAIAAFDGGFAVVFEDLRQSDHWADIYVARVGPNGVVLDPSGLIVQDGPGDQVRPAVACAAAVCLLAYDDVPVASYGRLLNADGTFAGPPVQLSSATGYSARAAATDDAGFWVFEDDSAVVASRVAFNGTVGKSLTLGPVTNSITAIAAAHDGTATLVVWAADGIGAVNYTVLAPDGNRPGGGTLPFPIGDVSVGTDGYGFLMAWSDTLYGFGDLNAARVANDGTVLDMAPAYLNPLGPTGRGPSITFHDGVYAISFQASDGSNYLSLMSPDSGVAGMLQPDPAPHERVDLHEARGPAGTVRVWLDKDVNGHAYVEGDAGVAPVTRSANGEGIHRVASSGRTVFTTWDEDNTLGLFAAAFDPSGQRLNGFQLPTTDTLYSSSVVWGGDRYLLMWNPSSGSAVNAQWVTETGQLSGPTLMLATGDYLSNIHAALGDGVLLVAWSHYTPASSDRVYVERFADGGALDPGPVDVGATGAYEPVGVVFAGGAFTVAWTDENTHLLLRSIDAAGHLSPQTVTLDAVTQGPCPQTVGLATSGTELLAVWHALDPASNWIHQVRALRLELDGGAPAPPVTLETDDGSHPQLADYAQPEVVWDGTQYVVTYETLSYPSNTGVSFVRVFRDGGFGAPERVIDGPLTEESPTLTVISPGRLAVVDLEFDPAANVDTLRAQLHIVAEVPDGFACGAGAQCLSSNCHQGICCQSDGGCVAAPDSGFGGGAGGGGAGGTGGGAGGGSALGGGAQAPRSFSVRCGCGDGGPALAGLLLLLGLARRRRR